MKIEQSLFFRRCHICYATTHQTEPVEYCEQCSKPMAPYYFFVESETPTMSADELRIPKMSLVDCYCPLRGLTAIWSARDT